MKDVKGSACFEDCETEFRYSLVWKKVAKYDERRFSRMMWADNNSLFSDDGDTLNRMVNDIIEGLMDLNMKLKPESLWLRSGQPGCGRRRRKLGDSVCGSEEMAEEVVAMETWWTRIKKQEKGRNTKDKMNGSRWRRQVVRGSEALCVGFVLELTEFKRRSSLS